METCEDHDEGSSASGEAVHIFCNNGCHWDAFLECHYATLTAQDFKLPKEYSIY